MYNVGIVLAIGIPVALAALLVLVLVAPVAWSRVNPGAGEWAARRAKRFSPRLARWYEDMTQEMRSKRGVDGL
jgi:O-antigen ligase